MSASRLKTPDNPAGTEQAAFGKTALALNEDFPRGFFRTFFGVDTAQDLVSDELLAWAHGVSKQAILKATLECLKSFSSTDFRSDLAQFKVPTRIIHGTDDKTVPIDASSRMVCLRPTSVGSPRTCSTFSGAELSCNLGNVDNGGHQGMGSDVD